ncbi:MAG: TCR/Tet family MFS transporter [Gammaproteobacteria bacterium]|nr:TCR/Tet family MFS transporter [Gammaproteobacteria bacterium]MDP2141808.1 TCR/Tet family MFS transporter [Gammaproteobacteria bacterium]MDP2348030.1 TCR/Tet family MFS transporter [Gammaproteobacteria bacterium]
MSHKYTITFVFATLLIDSIGFGIILPVMPQLIMGVSGEGLSSAARYGGWLMMVYALMQFFFSPIMGNVSDRFGRRPVLLISLLLLGIDYLVMAWAPTLFWLFIGRMVAGIAASTYSTCYAVIADTTPTEKRAQTFGLVGAAFGLGFIIGPVIGGILGEYGERVPFVAAACLAFANLIFGFFVMPETLPKENRRPFDIRRANPTGTLMALRKYPMVIGMISALFLFMMGHHALPSTWTYYTIEKFQWSESQVGYSFAFVGMLMVLTQAVLLRKVLPIIGQHKAAWMGFVFCIISFVGYAFAGSGYVLYIFMIPGALQGFVMPSINGIMSGHIPANSQGELQGGLASMSSLTAILSPPLMTGTFAFFTAASTPLYFPGASFFLAAVLTVCSLLVFMRAEARWNKP